MPKLKPETKPQISTKYTNNYYLDDRPCSTPRVLQAIQKISNELYAVKSYKFDNLFILPFPSSQLGKYRVNLEDFIEIQVHAKRLEKQGFMFTVDGVSVFHTLLHQELLD